MNEAPGDVTMGPTGDWSGRLRLPLIAAPMTGVSGPDLVVAACTSGVIGSFPAHNAGGTTALDAWLAAIRRRIDDASAADNGAGFAAPVAVNLVVHRTNAALADELDCVVRHGVELVITSVGSPAGVAGPLHEAGCSVYADVASLHHAERALDAGVDGLVLLTAGAGGQTGWANPFAFVRAVRSMFDGPLVLAGGVSDGVALWAALQLGCDLAYMGTKFIATTESLADDRYRQALVDSSLDDVTLSSALTGIPASIVAPTLPSVDGDSDRGAGDRTGRGFDRSALDRRSALSAGHSVSGVDRVMSVAELVERTHAEFDTARRGTSTAWQPIPSPFSEAE